jgi:hypothetical protein
MKPLTKGLLTGCAVRVVPAALAVVVGVRWLNVNGDRLNARVEQARAEGREFGRSATASASVAKGIEVYRGDTSFFGETSARRWLASCLENSTPESALCAQVPPKEEVRRTLTWRLAECSRLGMEGDHGCRRILEEVQTYCKSRR